MGGGEGGFVTDIYHKPMNWKYGAASIMDALTFLEMNLLKHANEKHKTQLV